MNKISKDKAREQLWRLGHLSFLLDSNQQSLWELFHKNPAKVQTWLLARRSGKSYALCVLAIEYCIKNPNSVIKYVAPTKDQVEDYILPIIDIDIIYKNNCPEDIKPNYVKSKKEYVFANGSVIQLCGAESGNIDSIRGGFAHIAIIDEAQDISKLKYAINSVLLPTTLTTKGKILISGTPPQDADHEFVEYIERGEANNTLIRRTVYDCPRHSKEDVELMLAEYGGEESEAWQREYLCKIIKSKTRSVLPEATDELLASITKVWPRPAHYNSYTGMDVGGKDWTVCLFGYYDFFARKIIIEYELAYPGQEMKLPTLTNDIKRVEELLWTRPLTNEFIKPKKRVSDHNLIVINEIARLSNWQLIFTNAEKNEKQINLNKLRVALDNGEIIIDPKCVTLIRHLKNAKWKSDTNHNEFARSADGSHYDAVDALLYLIRAIDTNDNPYPKGYNSPFTQGNTHYQSSRNGGFSPNNNSIKNEDTYLKMFGKSKPAPTGGKSAWLKHLKKD
jgi:hypothetical protein